MNSLSSRRYRPSNSRGGSGAALLPPSTCQGNSGVRGRRTFAAASVQLHASCHGRASRTLGMYAGIPARCTNPAQLGTRLPWLNRLRRSKQGELSKQALVHALVSARPAHCGVQT